VTQLVSEDASVAMQVWRVTSALGEKRWRRRTAKTRRGRMPRRMSKGPRIFGGILSTGNSVIYFRYECKREVVGSRNSSGSDTGGRGRNLDGQ